MLSGQQWANQTISAGNASYSRSLSELQGDRCTADQQRKCCASAPSPCLESEAQLEFADEAATGQPITAIKAGDLLMCISDLFRIAP